MKLDLIMGFWQRVKFWPYVEAGLAANSEHINQVIVVSDGPWEMYKGWLPTSNRVKITLLELPQHIGVGAPPVFLNHAYRSSVETEYVFQTVDDIVLVPGALEKFIQVAAPQRMVVGPLFYLRYLATSPPYPQTIFNHPDLLQSNYSHLVFSCPPNRAWKFSRSGHTLIHTPSHLEIGGQNELMSGGYGWEEQEYGVRWLERFGDYSQICLKDFLGIHLEPWEVGQLPTKQSPCATNFPYILSSLSRLYNKVTIHSSPTRFSLPQDFSALNLIHDPKRKLPQIHSKYDFILDCSTVKPELEKFKEVVDETGTLF